MTNSMWLPKILFVKNQGSAYFCVEKLVFPALNETIGFVFPLWLHCYMKMLGLTFTSGMHIKGCP